jgi:predicted nucleic acid-binding protein
MIVVADTGPIHYLVPIEAVEVLKPLYSRVLVPQTVAWELQGTGRRTRADLDRATAGVV